MLIVSPEAVCFVYSFSNFPNNCIFSWSLINVRFEIWFPFELDTACLLRVCFLSLFAKQIKFSSQSSDSTYVNLQNSISEFWFSVWLCSNRFLNLDLQFFYTLLQNILCILLMKEKFRLQENEVFSDSVIFCKIWLLWRQLLFSCGVSAVYLWVITSKTFLPEWTQIEIFAHIKARNFPITHMYIWKWACLCPHFNPIVLSDQKSWHRL